MPIIRTVSSAFRIKEKAKEQTDVTSTSLREKYGVRENGRFSYFLPFFFKMLLLERNYSLALDICIKDTLSPFMRKSADVRVFLSKRDK